ncbi:MAG: hypothetical protein HYV14_05350 [Elusimicrobia bacterium]|nr:hypothetical protein [Elusimicrobiota bacterium]
MLILLALLLAGPSPARAEGAPSSQAPGLDSADKDGDGVVSGKERRQKRRAERRARRGEKGPNGEIMSDEEADAADAAESSSRSASASGKASAAAAALKSSLPSMDAAGGLPGGTGAPGGREMNEGGRKSGVVTSASAGGSRSTPAGDAETLPSGDPGRPKAPSDFALAARSGYAPAFAAAGLKLGPDGKSVVRLDGKPATAEDYARLQREIASMPAALGRRPDFFSVVSPGHYADLKRGYKEKKEGDAVYKDVGTTAEDRDFVHTASCDKLSGDCNKNVEKASYKKGDFVAPEDLDSMWDALQKELDGSAEAGGLPSLATTRSDISRAAAMDAARALSYAGAGEDDAIRIATGEGPKTAPTQISQAVASLGRLWKRASSMTSPEAGGTAGGGSGAPIALGALALAALGAGALFLRRKG